MGMIKFEVPHQLSKEEVKRRLDMLAEHWGTKYGVKTEWAGEHKANIQGKAMGLSINANLNINDKSVDGEATDPGILFRSKAKSYLTEKFNFYLDPSKTLEELKKTV